MFASFANSSVRRGYSAKDRVPYGFQVATTRNGHEVQLIKRPQDHGFEAGPCFWWIRVECSRFPAWGVAADMAGGTSRVALNPGTPSEQEVRPFSDDNRWCAGDLVRIYSAGGGVWGDPLEREVALVEQDVRGGFVTPEGALRSYGVVILTPIRL